MKKVIKKLKEDGNHIIIISSRNNIQLSNPYDITQKWLSINGIEFGEVVTQLKEIDESTLSSPLKPVVRIATEEDIQHDKDNRAAEKEAHAICQKKISEHKLDMKLVTVEYTFDNSKILFYFTANGRVDFRSLVKDLAGVFKTRMRRRCSAALAPAAGRSAAVHSWEISSPCPSRWPRSRTSP